MTTHKKTQLTFVFLFFALTACAPLAIADENVRKEYWPSGNLKSEEPLVDGKKNGIGKYFHDNGAIYSEIPWKDDKKHGSFTLSRQDGSVEQKLSYLDGKKHGKIVWYDEKGNVYLEENYINDTLNGEVKKYYKDEKMKADLRYTNGKMHGYNVWYFENGKTRVDAHYKMGQLHGVGRWYNEDGSLKVTANYKDGEVVSQSRQKEKGKSFNASGWEILLPFLIAVGLAVLEATKRTKQGSEGSEQTDKRREKMAELSERVSAYLLGKEAWNDYQNRTQGPKAKPAAQKKEALAGSFGDVVFEEELKKQFRVASFLAWATLCSVFIYGGILYAKFKYFGNNSSAIENPDTIKYIFLGISLALFMMIPKMKSVILGDRDRPADFSLDVKKPSASTLITRLMTANIMILGICDIPAVLGLVFAIMTNNMNNYYLFAVISLVGIAVNFPKYEDWEYWINNKLVGI